MGSRLTQQRIQLTDNDKNDVYLAEENVTPKAKDTMRTVFQNVNGISIKNNIIAAEAYANYMNEMEADIIGIAKTNINFNRNDLQENFRTRIRNVRPTHKCVISHMKSESTDNHIRGGVAMILNGNWCGRTVATESDTMGRWASITLQGRQDSQIRIISAYRPCSSTNDGSKRRTVWMQQWERLREDGKKEPDPRKQCLSDLAHNINRTIDEWKKNGTNSKRGIMLTWDANGTTDTFPLENFMTQTGMVEIFDLKYGGKHNAPATYTRGTTKIDHIMITPNLTKHDVHQE